MNTTTRSRSLLAAAIVSSSILGLPAVASPSSAVSSFVTSVLVAPVAGRAASAPIDAAVAGSAADRFVGTVLAPNAGQITAPRAAEIGSSADTDSVNGFVQRVLVRGKAS